MFLGQDFEYPTPESALRDEITLKLCFGRPLIPRGL